MVGLKQRLDMDVSSLMTKEKYLRMDVDKLIEIVSKQSEKIKRLETEVEKLSRPPMYAVGTKHNLICDSEAGVGSVMVCDIRNGETRWSYEVEFVSEYDQKTSIFYLKERQLRNAKIEWEKKYGTRNGI
jgi:hypothetical protein